MVSLKEKAKDNSKKTKQKISDKKMKWYYKLIIAIIVGLVIAGIYIGLTYYNLGSTDKYASTNNNRVSNCRNVQVPYYSDVPYTEQEEYMKTEYYTETVPYTDRVCETKNIAYSIESSAFDYNTCNRQEEKCVDYFLGLCTSKITYCVDRSASCSMQLRNLDNEQAGTWSVKWDFLTSQGTLRSVDSSEYVYAQTSKKITGSVRITSQGEDGDANKNINTCNRQLTTIPTKQVCRDVIKTKEVQKSRQVTAYRPITKYRSVTNYKTEQQCD